MVKVFFSCHVEPRNSDGDISYLQNFFKDLKSLNKPVLLLLMTGETAQDRILKFVKENPSLRPKNCEIGLHVHGGDTASAIRRYQQIFGTTPLFISFGHWSYNQKDLEIAAREGVKIDFSYSGYRHNLKYFFKPRFKTNGLVEFPVCGNPKYPLNPLYTIYNFCLYFLFILYFWPSSQTLHFSFHSYDWSKIKGKLIFGLPLKYVNI